MAYDKLKQDVLTDLLGAQGMLGQAIDRLHPSLHLHKDLKKIDDDLDSLLDAFKDGDYDLEKKEG